ncbi:MAG: sensor histidine kinase [Actinomycetota bacterium]
MNRSAPTRISLRMLVTLEALLFVVLVLSWTVAFLAARGALNDIPTGSRNYFLALYDTDGRLWLSFVLGVAGAVVLVARHWYPTASFVAVSAIVLVIERSFPYVTRVQFATTIMLLVAVFWAMWRTRRFTLVALLALAVAAAITVPRYQVNRNLSTASSLELTSVRLVDLTSFVSTLQLMLLVAVAIGAAALIRRYDAQAAELAERNRELTEQRAASARAAVLDERVRIARELHDVVAHHVTTMTVHAGAARQVVAVKPEAATEALQQIEQAGRDAVLELQRLLGFLRGDDGRVDGDDAGRAPIPSLRHLDRLGASLGPEFDYELTVDGDLETVPQSVDVSAYRIVQEALTNVMKHSTADRAQVTVAAGGGEVAIRVVDDGTGPVAAGWGPDRSSAPASGLGLVGMRERASLHGGTISVGPDPDGGWLVEAVLPYEVSNQ